MRELSLTLRIVITTIEVTNQDNCPDYSAITYVCKPQLQDKVPQINLDV